MGFRGAGLFDADPEKVKATKAGLQGLADGHFKDYDMDTDRELFVNMLTKYRDDIDPALWPSQFTVVQDKYKGDFEAYADKIYSKSPLRSAEAFAAFLENPKQKTFDNDLAIAMSMSMLRALLPGTSPDSSGQV